MQARERNDLSLALAALADGDRSAFDRVFERAKPLVERYVRSVVRESSACDDIIQETLVKLFEQAHRYHPDRDAATWIVALAVWEVRSHIRDAKRARARFAADSATAQLSAPNDPEREVMERNALQAVRACLGELSEADREVLLSAWSDERPSGATFRKRLERAVTRLRVRWSARNGEDVS